MSDPTLDYLEANTAWWASRQAEQATFARLAWAREPQWGIFGIPDTEAGVLPTDVAGLDIVELGCGTAYVSAWLARRGRVRWPSIRRRASWPSPPPARTSSG